MIDMRIYRQKYSYDWSYRDGVFLTKGLNAQFR